MRLIDLDEFTGLSRRWVPNLSSVEKATNENDIWDLGYLECLKVIDACHVYKNLIPIEWIEKKLQKAVAFTHSKAEGKFIDNGCVVEVVSANFTANVLLNLLEDWEKENGNIKESN